MKNKSVFLNLFGSLFDKGLPIFTTAFITKYMSSHDYGLWSLFFAFLLISNTFITSPILTIFSRKFFSLSQGEQKMHIYFYKLLFLLQTICFLIFYLFFKDFTKISVFEICGLLLFNIYSYIGLFFRFKKWDMFYLIHSFIRLLIFSLLILIFIIFNGVLSYAALLISFVICHIPSLIHSLKYIVFKKDDDINDLKEFFSLSVYGASTSLVSNLDRFVISFLGFSMSFLGYYSFIYALTNVPTIFVEALKKTMVPIMFKEWSEKGTLSYNTRKYLYRISGLLLINQMLLPYLTYYFLIHFNLVNIDFIRPESLNYIIVLSVGFYFQNLYHFVNPYYFFAKKSINLLVILMLCLGMYLILINFVFRDSLSYISFMYAKSLLLVSVTCLTMIYGKIYFKPKLLCK